ncbi:MAG: glycoside hydrolase family 127 protein [Lewinellaceae bacterium]|nr:glycoside hydrolase family 127 protein [Lewinellaceae bacterium]
MINRFCFTLAALSLLFSCGQPIDVQRVAQLPTGRANDFYTGNRPPLTPNPLYKLPVGSIQPEGWARKQLELSASGMAGRLSELSRFLDKDGHAWLNPGGEGHSPWEELPYWLRGFTHLAYTLKDSVMIQEARYWIEAAMATQRANGYFGTVANYGGADVGRIPDLWPNMIMMDVLRTHYEATGDERVIKLLSRYFQWQRTIPDSLFLKSYWQHHRGGENLASVYWLYNQTGDTSLLSLSEKIHRNTADYVSGIPDWHNVNFAQAFREPATYYQQSGDERHLQATYRDLEEMQNLYGQVPGGMWCGDEDSTPSLTGPRQAIETCGIVELMRSCEDMLEITGDTYWADRCEDAAFNSLPASMMPALDALRYMTAPNMAQSDRENKCPGIFNPGPMMSMDPFGHRCCQHNHAHGWPLYTQHFWMATADNGLALLMPGASTVTAQVGDNLLARIHVDSHYPFSETVKLTFEPEREGAFPIYLRIPSWCAEPRLELNGRPLGIKTGDGPYLRLERAWQAGDELTYTLPMAVELKQWAKNKNAVSVNRGPLTYSLEIREQYERFGGTDEWPAYNILPATPWNYGLSRPEATSFKLVERTWPDDGQPWTTEGSPVALQTFGQRIPNWGLDRYGLTDTLQTSPIRSEDPEESLSLIPMGCARLRISAFPVTVSSSAAQAWKPQEALKPVQVSYYFQGGDDDPGAAPERIAAITPDLSIPTFCWWPHKGTREWVMEAFPEARRVDEVQVFWFYAWVDEVDMPESWKVQYRTAAGQWQDVKTLHQDELLRHDFNRTRFESVETTAIRVVVQLRPGKTSGLMGWQVR